jgi:SRSO17 transposase
MGVIGPIDETSVAKKGDKTPGVQRQYLGSVGKLENGIVTVHLGYVHGDFKALLDSDLFVPESWAANRERCRKASIPDDIPYRPKTAIAIAQVQHAIGNGLHFDWLVFDEGYGKDPSFLFALDALGQTWIGEVPKNFRCWPVLPQYQSQRKVRQQEGLQRGPLESGIHLSELAGDYLPQTDRRAGSLGRQGLAGASGQRRPSH